MSFFPDSEIAETSLLSVQRQCGPKRQVYLTQFNTPSMRNLAPLAAGLIYSYAKTIPIIEQTYDISIETERGDPQKVVNTYQNPYLLAYSAYFWNFNQSVAVAKAAKERFPNAIILFGGPSAPTLERDVMRFFEEHPYVDIVVAGEGEFVFADILACLAEGGQLSELDGISLRSQDGTVVYKKKRPHIKDVSVIPSPFLNGTFDDLFKRCGKSFTGVVWETNRGCPFTCTFCFWGGGDSKISQYPLDRVYAELDWIAANKIAYIFGADANFGILKRDLDIAKYLADLNRRTGFPKYFVINWTKNSTEKIFDIVNVLRDSTLKFMLTTSVQSHNSETLKAIKRQNIRLESFNKILEEANKLNFDTYSELILGLPLETYDSFVLGVEKVLVANINYNFNIYCCVLIPGTEMSETEYVERYGIETRRCIMNLGRSVHLEDTVPEYEDLIVGTNTMSTADWKRSHRFGFFTKALYGFRLAYFLFNYLRNEHHISLRALVEFIIEQVCADPERYPRFSHALALLDQLEESILSGGNETIRMEGIETSMHPPVAALIAALSDKLEFYRELNDLIQTFAGQSNVIINQDIYREIFAYQFAMIPGWKEENHTRLSFSYNIHEYAYTQGPVDSSTDVLKFGEGVTFKDADDFMGKQIYAGMVFQLQNVEVCVGITKECTSAQEWFLEAIEVEGGIPEFQMLNEGTPLKETLNTEQYE